MKYQYASLCDIWDFYDSDISSWGLQGDGGSKVLHNVGILLQHYKVS